MTGTANWTLTGSSSVLSNRDYTPGDDVQRDRVAARLPADDDDELLRIPQPSGRA